MACLELLSWCIRRVGSAAPIALVALLASTLAACSGTDTSGNGGGGGVTSSGGSAGSTSSAGDAALNQRCPNAIPALGEACRGVGSCVYRDCAGRGVVSASCAGSSIADVQTSACTAAPCGDTACPVGSICVSEFLSDASTTTRCVSDPCGTGPTGCEYACYANLCPQGLMCYSAVAGGRREVDCQAP